MPRGQRLPNDIRSRFPVEYKCWTGMIERCYYEKQSSYPWYGGRGIIVCERWRASFENFLEDMGPKPSPDLTLERKDNNGNYEPSNCKWATTAEQGLNKRSNRWITHAGLTLTLTGWAKHLGVSPATLYRRLHYFPLDQALRPKELGNFRTGPKKKLKDISE